MFSQAGIKGFTKAGRRLIGESVCSAFAVGNYRPRRKPYRESSITPLLGNSFRDSLWSFSLNRPLSCGKSILLWAQHPCLFPRGLVRSSGIKTFPVSCSQQGDCARIPFPCEGSRGKLGLPDSGCRSVTRLAPFLSKQKPFNTTCTGHAY